MSWNGMQVNNLAECIELCFDSQNLFGFDCRSVLYFYEVRPSPSMVSSKKGKSRRTL